MPFHSTARPQWLDEALEFITLEMTALDQNHPDPLVGDYRVDARQFEYAPAEGFYVYVQKLNGTDRWVDVSRVSETVMKHDSTSKLADTAAALYDNAQESR
ncbi:hypothetical protein SEA_HOLLOW_99 [Gordonia phage Hollow]|nr:hypothetical protein SEA_HOLLOW_99 [Gordonia phage Hollow]